LFHINRLNIELIPICHFLALLGAHHIFHISRIRVKNDLKEEDALSLLLSNFALEYAIQSVHVNQNGLKLRGIHQRLVYADDVTGGLK